MRLTVLAPTEVVLDQEVDKVVAEGPEGAFCVKPRHVDLVAPLVPGILELEARGEQRLLAVDSGLLVKQGSRLWVSVLSAVTGEGLEQLAATVRERFEQLDRREQRAQQALARLEAALLGGLGDSARAREPR